MPAWGHYSLYKIQYIYILICPSLSLGETRAPLCSRKMEINTCKAYKEGISGGQLSLIQGQKGARSASRAEQPGQSHQTDGEEDCKFCSVPWYSLFWHSIFSFFCILPIRHPVLHAALLVPRVSKLAEVLPECPRALSTCRRHNPSQNLPSVPWPENTLFSLIWKLH